MPQNQENSGFGANSNNGQPQRIDVKPVTIQSILGMLNRELERAGYMQMALIVTPTPATSEQAPTAMILAQDPLPISAPFASAAIKTLIPLALPEAGAQAEQITGIALKLAPAIVRAMSERGKQATIMAMLQKLAAEAGVNLFNSLTGGFFKGGAGAPR